jgi:RNA polymerase II subunit A small phosphatase-like protein
VTPPNTPPGIIQERYFRESCGPDFAKNLHIVHADLRNVVIVDNSPGAYVGHEENAVPIATWYNNQV